MRPLRRPLVANLSGPTGLIAPAATGADWADADGMGFANTGSSGGDRWANYVSLYGPAQTYVCAPSPLAQGGPVCARNPEATEMLDAFNTQGLAAGGGRGGFGAGGECFGFSSTAILFSLGASDPAWTGRVLPAAQLTRRGGLSALTEASTAAVVNRGRRRKATRAVPHPARHRQGAPAAAVELDLPELVGAVGRGLPQPRRPHPLFDPRRPGRRGPEHGHGASSGPPQTASPRATSWSPGA